MKEYTLEDYEKYIKKHKFFDIDDSSNLNIYYFKYQSVLRETVYCNFILVDGSKGVHCFINIVNDWNKTDILYQGRCHSPGHLKRIIEDVILHNYPEEERLKLLKEFIDDSITIKAKSIEEYNLLKDFHALCSDKEIEYISYNGEIFYKLILDYDTP
jgi:hypothetical protein